MELVLSIFFGIWFLIGAIFYGFITRIDYKNNDKMTKRKKGNK